MKKLIAVLLCLCTLAVPASAMSVQMTVGNTQVVSVGAEKVVQTQEIETAPFTVNGRTMVPVRIIAEKFGAQVDWAEETRTVTIQKDGKVITLVLDSATAQIDGVPVTLDVAATEVGGRTFVPLRFITETFGYNVKYLPSVAQIYITDSPIVMQSKYSFVTAEEFAFLYKMYENQMLPNVTSGATEEEIQQAKLGLADGICNLFGFYLSLYDYIVYQMPGGMPASVFENVAAEVEMGRELVYSYGVPECVYAMVTELGYVGINAFDVIASTCREVDLQHAYESAYIRAKHILIPTVDLNNGAALSPEEVQAALTLAQDLCAQIAQGADFDSLMHAHSADGGLSTNPDGYVFTAGEMVDEFYDAAAALEIGQVSAPVESVFGYHIIQRLPLGELIEEFYEEALKAYVDAQSFKILLENPVQLTVDNLEALLELL